MSSWKEDLADRVAAAAIRASQRVHPTPGHITMTQALRAAGIAVAEGAAPEVIHEHAAVAMRWANVLLAEGGVDPSLVPLVCGVFNLSLVPLARTEVLGIFPRPHQELLLAATYSMPAVRQILLDEPVVPPSEIEMEDEPTAALLRAEAADEPDDLDVPHEKPARRVPAPSWEPQEAVQPPRPPIAIAVVRATPRDEFYYGVVELALDKLGPCGRRLRTDPSSEWTDIEASMLKLSDAVLAVGGSCLRHVVTFWRRSLAIPSPWSTYAACFALARIDALEAILALRDGLEGLPLDAVGHGAAAARALCVGPHPEIGRLAGDLMRSSHPIARGVGLEVLAELGVLPPADLQRHLVDGNPAVLHAAMRVVSRLQRSELKVFAETLSLWQSYPDRQVALPAAVGLLRTGDTRPVDDIRARGRLASVLGAEALELLILGGSNSDLPVVEALVGLAPSDAATLEGLARFGHPGVWSFLVHHLEDDDLVDDAVGALELLFGPLVEGKGRTLAGPWRTAIGDGRFDPTVRYRSGKPFSPAVVAAEALSPLLSEIDLERRRVELECRADTDVRVQLTAWTSVKLPQVAALVAAGIANSPGYPQKGWT